MAMAQPTTRLHRVAKPVQLVQLVALVAGTAVIFGILGFTGRHPNVLVAGVLASAYAAVTGLTSRFLCRANLAKADHRSALEEQRAGLS
jgi:hypothetical protein